MPALSRGQANTPDRLNWFITVNGVLTDAFDVGFQIWDLSAGPPGVQIFPATPGTWADVTSNAGRFSVGSYYAFDAGAATGWTPSLVEPIGTHRIKWRWKITAGAPYQAGDEDFEVLVQSAGSTADTYIQVSDLRAIGITTSIISDVDALAAIKLWQAVLERACRQWFVPKQLAFEFDGNDSDTIHFGVPIISIDYLRINTSTDNLDPALFKVYNARTYPDDRHNPKISLLGPEAWRDIYVAPLTWGRMKFRKGRKNQAVSGLFGYTESDGSTPEAIKRALLKLVVEKVTRPVYVPAGSPPPAPSPLVIAGVVIEEQTDDHRLKYGGSSTGARRVGLSGITNDPEILDIIKLYRAPLGVATPANWSYD